MQMRLVNAGVEWRPWFAAVCIRKALKPKQYMSRLQLEFKDSEANKSKRKRR